MLSRRLLRRMAFLVRLKISHLCNLPGELRRSIVSRAEKQAIERLVSAVKETGLALNSALSDVDSLTVVNMRASCELASRIASNRHKLPNREVSSWLERFHDLASDSGKRNDGFLIDGLLNLAMQCRTTSLRERCCDLGSELIGAGMRLSPSHAVKLLYEFGVRVDDVLDGAGFPETVDAAFRGMAPFHMSEPLQPVDAAFREFARFHMSTSLERFVVRRDIERERVRLEANTGPARALSRRGGRL
jgi:hypothetical protein